MNERGWARFVCRVMLGLMFLMAGWFKVFHLSPAGHAEQFFTGPYADTWIPGPVLWTLGVTIPFLELVAGALLIVGWRTRGALVALGGLLLIVTYGHLLKDPLFSIVQHILPRTALLVAILLLPAVDDILSVDAWLVRRRGAPIE